MNLTERCRAAKGGNLKPEQANPAAIAKRLAKLDQIQAAEELQSLEATCATLEKKLAQMGGTAPEKPAVDYKDLPLSLETMEAHNAQLEAAIRLTPEPKAEAPKSASKLMTLTERCLASRATKQPKGTMKAETDTKAALDASRAEVSGLQSKLDAATLERWRQEALTDSKEKADRLKARLAATAN